MQKVTIRYNAAFQNLIFRLLYYRRLGVLVQFLSIYVPFALISGTIVSLLDFNKTFLDVDMRLVISTIILIVEYGILITLFENWKRLDIPSKHKFVMSEEEIIIMPILQLSWSNILKISKNDGIYSFVTNDASYSIDVSQLGGYTQEQKSKIDNCLQELLLS